MNEQTETEVIEIPVTLALSDYKTVLDRVNFYVDPISEYVMLSADCIIRTWFFDEFFEWFHMNGLDVMDHYYWSELPGNLIPMIGAGDVADDITVTVGFPGDCKSEALMFKLTFGGAA